MRLGGGEALAAELQAVAPAGRVLRRAAPPEGRGKDWNEVLTQRLALGSPGL